MIGPFTTRSIAAVALAAAGVALILLLAKTEIPAGPAAPSGLYVIDSEANGIAEGERFLLPPTSHWREGVSLRSRTNGLPTRV